MKKCSWRASLACCALTSLLLAFGCAGTPGVKVSAPKEAVSLSLAWSDLWENRFDRAESAFRDALAAKPGDPEASRGLALALFAKGGEEESATLILKALSADPLSPFLGALHSFAYEVIPDGTKTLGKIKALADKETLKKMPLPARREGFKFLIDYYRFYGPNPGEARKCADQLGAIHDWKIVGPFPNASASGFAVDYIGETSIKQWGTGDFSARDGRKMKWTAPDILPLDGFIRPENYLGYERWGSVFYALGSFTSETGGAVRIDVEHRGAAALWLDGAPVFSDAEDKLNAEFMSSPISVAKGEHQILVKIGSENLVAGFRIIIESVQGEGTWKQAAAAIGALEGAVAGDSHEGLGFALASTSAAPSTEASFWCARALCDHGYYAAALAEIRAARSAAGGSALFDYLEYQALGALGRDREARAALVRSTGKSMSFAPAVDLIAGEAIAEKRLLEARSILDQARPYLGNWRRGALRALSLAIAEEGAVYEKAQAYAEAFPDSPDAAVLLVNEGLGFGFDFRALIAEIKAKGRPYEADRLLLNAIYRNGSLSEINALAASRAEISPDVSRNRYLMADSAIRLGKFNMSDALEYTAKLATSFPGSSDLSGLAAAMAESDLIYRQKSIAESKSKDAKAKKDLEASKKHYIERLEESLWLKPSSYGLRKELRSAKGLPNLDYTETLTSAETAIGEYERDRGGQAAKDADAEIILDQASTWFFGDGASRFYRLYVVKPLSLTAVEAESTQELGSGYGIEVTQAYTLKADGTKVEARIGESSVSFPGLAPGDYLVLRWQGNSYNEGALSRQFWLSAPLQRRYPAHSIEAKVVFPEGVLPVVAMRGTEGLPISRNESPAEAGMRGITFSGKNIPAAGSGYYSAGARDTSAWVDISTMKDWWPVAAWYRDLFYGRARPTEPVVRKARELTAGIADRRGKIAALFDFVANEIAYEDLSFMYSAQIPQPAGSVLEDRFGDCKDKCALLVSLLSACGIEARVALSAPEYKGDSPYLPSTRFSHVIVQIPDPAGDLLLDPTANFSTFPRLPEELRGTWYLPIARDGELVTALSRVPFTSDLPPLSVYLEVSFSEDGRAEARGSAMLSGGYAAALRSALAPLDGKRRDSLTTGLVYSLLPGLTLDAYGAEGLAGGDSKDPVLSFEGALAPPSFQGDIVALSLPWATRLPIASEVLSNSTASAFAIDYPELGAPVRETVVARIPSGWAAGDLPANAEFTYGGAYARFKYSRSGSSIVCERELYLPYLFVPPADKAAFLAFVEAVAGKGRELLLLRR